MRYILKGIAHFRHSDAVAAAEMKFFSLQSHKMWHSGVAIVRAADPPPPPLRLFLLYTQYLMVPMESCHQIYPPNTVTTKILAQFLSFLKCICS